MSTVVALCILAAIKVIRPGAVDIGGPECSLAILDSKAAAHRQYCVELGPELAFTGLVKPPFGFEVVNAVAAAKVVQYVGSQDTEDELGVFALNGIDEPVPEGFERWILVGFIGRGQLAPL